VIETLRFLVLLAVCSACLSVLQAADPEVNGNTPSPVPSPSPSGQHHGVIPSNANFKVNFRNQTSLNDHLTLKKGTPVDLIFIGDSITEQWRWGPGLPVWRKYYEDRAIDFGIGGDRTEHVLWRLSNLPIRDFHPKVAVILIGTNNSDASNTPETIAEGVKAILARTKETFPGIKIVLVSILPNARATEKMAAANALIKECADGDSVIWLDLASKMKPERGNWKGLQSDKLHLSTQGYEMWAAELNPILDRIAPKAAQEGAARP